MKPLHIGLLVVGAALAGGLAVKMTDLQPVPPIQVASSLAVPVPVRKTAPAREPAAVEPAPQKPSPMPRTIAPAPAPVYVEPVHVETVRVEPARVEQIAPKSKPIVIAKAAPLPPLLPPIPYEPPPQVTPPPPEPPPIARRSATLPPGMTIAVRLDESLSNEHAIAGDTFNASLSEPLVVDGLVIAERGARARGLILGTQRAGRVSGTSSLDLELTMVETADGQKVEISTVPWTKRGDTSYGASTPAVFRGKPVNVPAETVIRFRLEARVTITERPL